MTVQASSTTQRDSALRARLVLVGYVALAIAGVATAVLGTVSSFTSSQSKGQTSQTGTFVFNLADPASGATFATAISGVAPGDFADRLVTLTNTGSIYFSSVALAVTAGTTSLLDSDAVNGLTLQIDKCSTTWTQSGNTVAATCGGTLTSLTSATPLSTLKSTGPTYTTGLAALTGGTDYLRFHYALPTASTGTAGLSSTLSYAFTATQAAGGAYH